jgi:hypothetical protein
MKCCQERSAQLMEYSEGSLPAEQEAELEMHLSDCSCCRDELGSLRRLEAQLRAFPLVGEPIGFRSSVMSRITATQAASIPVAYRRVDPALVAGLGVLLLGIAALLAGAGDASTWEFIFDGGYWLDLTGQVAAAGWGVVGGAVGFAFSGLAQTVYADLAESAPVLAAAVLLAIFAIGPSELMSAVRLQSTDR